MVDVLENKRTATRFRILVEIADRQPAVSQGEIAEAVGITSQAVSEYTRELVGQGLVKKEGRSNYRVTKEGVDWLLQAANEMRDFVDHVTEDVLGSVQEEAAIATDGIDKGDRVSLRMDGGLLHAEPGGTGPATGIATTDAEPGEDVGVTGFQGIIDLEAEPVHIIQVPSIRMGGSRHVSPTALADRCAAVDVLTATGIEAIVACHKADLEPATIFGVDHVAADAASVGLRVGVVTTGDVIGRVTTTLRDSNIDYEVVEVDRS